MLDVARHFFPKEEVKRHLDVMFRLRLNTFHWHIADDQGFRIALSRYPKLEEVASRRAYSAIGGFAGAKGNDGKPQSGCYSEADVREITAYAAARGIEVIPELDMPGHSSAIIAAYPELSCDGKAIEVPGTFGILDNIICIGNDAALEFMTGIVHDICDLTGAKQFHIGFDEVKLDHLKTCPRCRAKMKALGLTKVEELKAYAKDYFRDGLKKRGVEVIVYNDGMDRADTGVVCYYWLPIGKHRKNIISWVNQRQKVIIAPTTHLYTDYPYAWTSLKKTFSLNPVLPGIEKTENIIGVEAPVWTEYIEDHERLAFNTYYRMAALAEIGWHGRGESYADFMRNLRAREEYYFDERLDIPERVLNPGPLTRLHLAKQCMVNDMSYEFKQYKGIKT